MLRDKIEYYGDRIKCPKQTGLSTVEITISTLDSFEFSDILFCLGSTWYLKYRDKQEEKEEEEEEKEGIVVEGEEDKEEE